MNPLSNLLRKGRDLFLHQISLLSLVPILLFIAGALLIHEGFTGMERKEELATVKHANQVLTSVISRERDRANTETVSRQALELERDELLWMLADSSSKIAQLQAVVKKAGPRVKSATVASTLTTINTSTASVTHLTNSKDSTKTGEVSYSGFVDKKWVQGYIYADKDSIRLENLLVRNEFEVWQKDERAGLFKPLRPVVYFRSVNPYTSVTDIQSYTVKPKKQPGVVRMVKGVVFGLAIYGAADLAANFFL